MLLVLVGSCFWKWYQLWNAIIVRILQDTMIPQAIDSLESLLVDPTRRYIYIPLPSLADVVWMYVLFKLNSPHTFHPLMKPSTGLSWPFRQFRASGSVCRPGLLREIGWLTGNDTHWELASPGDSLPACLPARLLVCLLSLGSRNGTNIALLLLFSS